MVANAFSGLQYIWILLALSSSFRWMDMTSVRGTSQITCPKNCACEVTKDRSHLTINCVNRTDEYPSINIIFDKEESLADEINDTLSTLDNLTFLNITNSKLVDLPVEICSKNRLQELHLDRNWLSSLPDQCLKRLTDLRILTADNNRITRLQDGMLTGQQHPFLRKVSFAFNRISEIGTSLFSNSLEFLNLKSINIADNDLETIDMWPFVRAQAYSSVEIKVSNNRIRNFTNAIGWRYNCSMAKLSMKLNLNGNQMSHLIDTIDAFHLNRSIELICMFRQHGKLIITLVNNPFQCDCMDFQLYSLFHKYPHATQVLNGVECKGPSGKVLGLKPDAVALDDLVCDVITKCPSGCSCRNQPSQSSFHIICTELGLTDLPLLVPSVNTPRSMFIPRIAQYNISMSKNNISHLNDRPYFTNTKILDLSNSNLKEITTEAFLKLENISLIYFHGNKLTALPPAIVNMSFAFKSLSLYNNPWSCECGQVWFKYWLLSLKVKNRLENPSGIGCNYPDRLKGTNIFDVNDDDFCTDPNWEREKKVIIVSITPAVLIIIVSLGLMTTAYRYRVKVFAIFGIHPLDRDECVGEDMEYDVFLSFATEDRDRALEVLKFLQKNDNRVCFHEQHFLYGSPILENIDHAVCKSKRVLCLVSEFFVASEYCMYEFTRAHIRNLELKRSRLVVILLHQFPFPDAANILRNFVNSHTYITWEESSWKQHVLYSMPLNRFGNGSDTGEDNNIGVLLPEDEVLV